MGGAAVHWHYPCPILGAGFNRQLEKGVEQVVIQQVIMIPPVAVKQVPRDQQQAVKANQESV